jgi:hypothetical protein
MKIIIADALLQMKNWIKIMRKNVQELEANGDETYYQGTLSNLQIRISFLQEVVTHENNEKKLKNIGNEQIM